MVRFRIIQWGPTITDGAYLWRRLKDHFDMKFPIWIEDGDTLLRIPDGMRRDIEMELLAQGIGWRPEEEDDATI